VYRPHTASHVARRALCHPESPGFPAPGGFPYASGVGTPSPLLREPVVTADLARVEAALAASVADEDPFLTEVVSHLLNAGGKRGRPLFCLAAAATCTDHLGPAPEPVVMGGVSVELVHLGSLYHDDVMDEADTRRQVESVNARWDNLTAILAGDYLLAKASEIAADLGTEVAGLLARTISRLCAGQVSELRSAFDTARTEDAYLQSIEGKTAALFATASRIGALTVGAPRPEVEALTSFGLGYGMAFQIVDDVLDITASPDQIGKPTGHDLVEGVYTLPVLRCLAAGGPTAGKLTRMLGAVPDDATVAEARALVRDSGQVESALDTAAGYVDAACAALGPLAGSAAGTAMVDHARSLVAGGRAMAASAA